MPLLLMDLLLELMRSRMLCFPPMNSSILLKVFLVILLGLFVLLYSGWRYPFVLVSASWFSSLRVVWVAVEFNCYSKNSKMANLLYVHLLYLAILIYSAHLFM